MAFGDGAALLLLEAGEGAALVGGGVRAEAVGLAAFVVLGQVFGDGKTFLIAKEQSVAVLPALHLFAGADPELLLDLRLLVLEEHAGAERFPDLVGVLGEADDEEFGDLALRVEVGAGLLGEVVDELPHFGEGLGLRDGTIRVGGLVERHGGSRC